MNSLKLVTVMAIATGLATGASPGPAAPAGEPRDPQGVRSLESFDVPESMAGMRLLLSSRLVVASADSGYAPVASGGGLRREQ